MSTKSGPSSQRSSSLSQKEQVKKVSYFNDILKDMRAALGVGTDASAEFLAMSMPNHKVSLETLRNNVLERLPDSQTGNPINQEITNIILERTKKLAGKLADGVQREQQMTVDQNVLNRFLVSSMLLSLCDEYTNNNKLLSPTRLYLAIEQLFEYARNNNNTSVLLEDPIFAGFDTVTSSKSSGGITRAMGSKSELYRTLQSIKEIFDKHQPKLKQEILNHISMLHNQLKDLNKPEFSKDKYIEKIREARIQLEQGNYDAALQVADDLAKLIVVHDDKVQKIKQLFDQISNEPTLPTAVYDELILAIKDKEFTQGHALHYNLELFQKNNMDVNILIASLKTKLYAQLNQLIAFNEQEYTRYFDVIQSLEGKLTEGHFNDSLKLMKELDVNISKEKITRQALELGNSICTALANNKKVEFKSFQEFFRAKQNAKQSTRLSGFSKDIRNGVLKVLEEDYAKLLEIDSDKYKNLQSQLDNAKQYVANKSDKQLLEVLFEFEKRIEIEKGMTKATKILKGQFEESITQCVIAQQRYQELIDLVHELSKKEHKSSLSKSEKNYIKQFADFVPILQEAIQREESFKNLLIQIMSGKSPVYGAQSRAKPTELEQKFDQVLSELQEKNPGSQGVSLDAIRVTQELAAITAAVVLYFYDHNMMDYSAHAISGEDLSKFQKLCRDINTALGIDPSQVSQRDPAALAIKTVQRISLLKNQLSNFEEYDSAMIGYKDADKNIQQQQLASYKPPSSIFTKLNAIAEDFGRIANRGDNIKQLLEDPKHKGVRLQPNEKLVYDVLHKSAQKEKPKP